MVQNFEKVRGKKNKLKCVDYFIFVNLLKNIKNNKNDTFKT